MPGMAFTKSKVSDLDDAQNIMDPNTDSSRVLGSHAHVPVMGAYSSPPEVQHASAKPRAP